MGGETVALTVVRHGVDPLVQGRVELSNDVLVKLEAKVALREL